MQDLFDCPRVAGEIIIVSISISIIWSVVVVALLRIFFSSILHHQGQWLVVHCARICFVARVVGVVHIVIILLALIDWLVDWLVAILCRSLARLGLIVLCCRLSLCSDRLV